jgi:hypothetical protein
MIISDVVLQNQKLSQQMEAYKKEIEKLDRLRDMIRQKSFPKKQYEYVLSMRLKGIITIAINDFEKINDMYDQNVHNCKEVQANEGKNFIQLAAAGSEYLQSQFSKIKNSVTNQFVL